MSLALAVQMKGLGALVVAVDLIADGNDELLQVPENSAPDSAFCQIAEEAFDHVQPRGRSWREVHMEAFVSFQPALDALMFVGTVVVADDVNLLLNGHSLVDHAQELQPFLMPVALLA